MSLASDMRDAGWKVGDVFEATQAKRGFQSRYRLTAIGEQTALCVQTHVRIQGGPWQERPGIPEVSINTPFSDLRLVGPELSQDDLWKYVELVHGFLRCDSRCEDCRESMMHHHKKFFSISGPLPERPK
jgi:hypothetical protein